MQHEVYENYEKMSFAAAQAIKNYINSHPGALICLAAGDTPLGAFKELIAMQQRREVDLSSANYVSLDEWWGLGYETKGSCAQVMRDCFYTPAGIPEDRLTLFNGLAPDIEREKARVAEKIAGLGGVSLFLLGIGLNGHLGFIEPGPLPRGRVCDLPLDDVTIKVSPKYFGSQNVCLTRGITVGMDEMLAADEVILIANGAKKAEIINRLLTETPSGACPAAMMKTRAGKTRLLTDREAACKR